MPPTVAELRQKLVLTTDEAAVVAQTFPSTICSEIRKGALRAKRVGKGYRISWPALNEWLGTDVPVPDPGVTEPPTAGLAVVPQAS